MLTTRFHESWITNFYEYFSQSERVSFCLFSETHSVKELREKKIMRNFGLRFRETLMVRNFIILEKPYAQCSIYLSKRGDEKSKKYQKLIFSLIIALSCFNNMTNSNQWVIFKIKIVMLILQLLNSPLWETV